MARAGGDALQSLRFIERGGGLAWGGALTAEGQQFALAGMVEHKDALGGEGVGGDGLHYGGGESGGD